jgi:hypothetical protein
MKITKYLLCLSLVLSNHLCIGQSFAGLTLGLECAEISAAKNSIWFQVYDPYFGSRGYSIGARLDHFIKKSIYLSLDGSYTFTRRVRAYDIGFEPFDHVRFRSLQSRLITNWIPFSNFNVGIGVGYNYIPSIYKFRGEEKRDNLLNNRQELGATYAIGYYYKGFHLGLSFYDGMKVLGNKKRNIFKPINSFNLSLSYMFEVLDKLNGDKVNCPRL